MPVTPRPSSSRTSLRILAAAGLAALVLVQAMAAVAAGAAPAAGLRPTIHWEEARAHEHDRIAFRAGGRVTVGFKPRRSDHWSVGGVPARALPAGRLDGATMRTRLDGRVARPAVDPAVDRPIVDPADVIAARSSVATAPAADQPGARERQAPVDPGALRREVFGFLPYWQVNGSSLRIQYDKISTIAYFGVGADARGNLQKRNSDGSVTAGWAGWTSSKITSIINAAHSTGTRVVLTVQSFAWNAIRQGPPEGAARQLDCARQSRAPDRRGRPRPRSRRGQPGLRAARDRRRGRVHRAGPQVRPRLDAATAATSSRSTRLGTSATTRSSERPRRRRRRHLHHGLRLPRVRQQPGRQRRAASRAGLRHPRHGRRLCRAGLAVEADPRGAVLRPGVVDRHRPGPRQEHQRDEIRCLGDCDVQRCRAVLRGPRQAGTRRPSRSHGPPIDARTARPRMAA